MARVADDSKHWKREALLDTESSVMYFLCEPSITTISFFQGEDDGEGKADFAKSVEWLKERITLICRANPWLTGRLVKKDKKIHKTNVLLSVPENVTEDDIDAIMWCCGCDPCEGEDKDESEPSSLTNISMETPYPILTKAVTKSKATVPMGYRLIGKEERVSKFTLFQVAKTTTPTTTATSGDVSKNQLALVVSITHAVADGYTYYKIMSMLTDSTPIESMSYVRKHNFLPQMKRAIGEAEHDLLVSPGLAMSMMSSMLCGCGCGSNKTRLEARFVDEEKIQQAKTEATERCGCVSSSSKDNDLDDENDRPPESAFACSTNDIITSTFSKAAKADILLMAINLRNRVEEAKDNDSGNYESVVLYDGPSTQTPEAIRQSLRGGAPFLRVGGAPLPGFFKLFQTRFALITNWVFPSFPADLKLLDANGEKKCSINLHLPLFDSKAVFFPIAIVFRPCPGKLAVLYGGNSRDLSYDRLVASGSPIGGRVNDAMFED